MTHMTRMMSSAIVLLPTVRRTPSPASLTSLSLSHPQENKGTHERVVRNRQYQIDAAVVRIMKVTDIDTLHADSV